MFSNLFALSALLGFMAALPVKSAQIQVTVGGPGGIIQYNPSSVNANVGDVVNFVFMQKNHTATQSTFASPCTPVSGGFDTGFVPVPDSNTNGPFQQAQLTVTDLNPVWVYCRQTGHCQKGMVFAINPGTQFAAFQAAAMGSSSTQTSATSAASPAATSATPAATATSPAATSAAPAATATSPTSTSQDHRIIVGGGPLTFQPSNITAQPGDTVTFEFHVKNHTVTQSSFAAPCVKLASTSTSGQVGFDSGFMPVAAGATTFPTFTVQVNDTAPIWAYCRQQGHCGQGMVFAVNANESSPKSFEAFEALAMQLNGTTSTTNTTSSSTTGKNGAGVVRLGGTGVVVSLVAVIVGLSL
jgi:plastocyanin